MTLEPLRFSQLKRIGQSPAHYRAAIQPEGAHLGVGSAVHSVLLGGKPIATWDKLSDNGNARPRRGREFEAWAADQGDALILLPDEFDEVSGMVASVRACPEAMRVLQGVQEQTILFDYMGRPCRTTPDVRSDEYETELKTCRSSDPKRFMWDAMRMAYHGQHAWHQLGIEQAGLGNVKVAFTVAVESAAPYVVTVFRLTARALEMGARTNRLWFERLLACEAADEWPGYVQSVTDLDVPAGGDIDELDEEEAA